MPQGQREGHSFVSGQECREKKTNWALHQVVHHHGHGFLGFVVLSLYKLFERYKDREHSLQPLFLVFRKP